MKHTAGKLTVDATERVGGFAITTDSDRVISVAFTRDPHPTLGTGMTHDEARAKAAQIARTWNCHDDLVEAVNLLLGSSDGIADASNDDLEAAAAAEVRP